MMEIPKVCHSELRVKLINDALKKNWRRGSKDDVVDIQEQICSVAALMIHEEGDIRRCRRKPKLTHVSGKTLEPRPRRLLQAVERALKKADMIRSSRINKTRRLLTVNSLLKMSMKKSILHVQLSNRPRARGSYTQHSPN